jgi:hypothetical protein
MKQNHTHRNICSIGAALLLVLGLTQCSFTKKNCCGYRGPVVSPAAISLYATDHFIPKEMIDKWTARYEAQTGLPSNGSLKMRDLVLSNSYSFNGRYVSLILCNKDCIGLRILLGMDEDSKVHIILVGIKPDYSTLYIPKPGLDFALLKGARAMRGVNSIEEEMPVPYETIVGGLQFSQKP